MSFESLTPIQIEQKLRELVTALTTAQRALADARDIEVDADITYMRARDRAEWEALRRAESQRRKAEELLRVTRDQAEVVRSLGASVRTAYEMAGTG